MNDWDTLSVRPTADGSLTFFSERFQETFHSTFGAKEEAELKFVLPCRLPERLGRVPVTILDVCLGLGYNSAAAVDGLAPLADGFPPVHLVGLEYNPAVLQRAIAQGLTQIWSPLAQAVLAKLAAGETFGQGNLRAEVWWGDARQTIAQMPTAAVDAVFLDPFSPRRCPELWTWEFLQAVTRCLKPTGYLATYCCAAAVRATLRDLGLHLWASEPLGRKAPGTIAAWTDLGLPPRCRPLTPPEWDILNTRAGLPYRDPTLTDPAAVILARRAEEQSRSDRQTSSQWLKRHRSP
ncbi:MAG: tRNA (5-methylaminomethyl-2-thiouridine)(34)-methyltransferase MnmD [Pseudanabaenaceae cyanobacterium]